MIENHCSITIHKDGNVSNYAGCNDGSGEIKKCTKDSVLAFILYMTQKYCGKTGDMENQLAAAISLIRTYTINSNEILFVLEDKTTIKAVAETKQ